jgi:glucoside 3-dehydrogenase (cytochrome c) catalytic subunit
VKAKLAGLRDELLECRALRVRVEMGADDCQPIPPRQRRDDGQRWLQHLELGVADGADALHRRRAGATNIRPFVVPDRVPGYAIHELGVARMGADRKTSVLNQFQQTHDIGNLFVMDGAGFSSSACQNPTLTIMALAVRSTDHLLNEMKQGSI